MTFWMWVVCEFKRHNLPFQEGWEQLSTTIRQSTFKSIKFVSYLEFNCLRDLLLWKVYNITLQNTHIIGNSFQEIMPKNSHILVNLELCCWENVPFCIYAVTIFYDCTCCGGTTTIMKHSKQENKTATFPFSAVM